MARVTVEDCVERVPNRFELVMLAAQRARQIGSGAALTLDRDNDKNPVVSLREIAAETVTTDDLREELLKSHQRVIEMDDSEDVIDMMEGEEEWNSMIAQATEQVELESRDDDDDDDLDDSSLEDIAGGSPDL